MGKAKKLKAAVYSPYFETLGGGEKYVAAAILSFLKKGIAVDIFSHDQELLRKIKDRFDYNISKARIFSVGKKVIEEESVLKKYQLLKNYDYSFFVSDGSVPLLFSQKNLLHFQVPFHEVNGRSLANQVKLKSIHEIVVNSEFTKKIIDKEFGVESQVVYPPSTMIDSQTKENMILSVGRFDNLMQSKRQDIMIQAFQEMKVKDWSLVLAGGSLHGEDQLESLKKLIKDNKHIKLLVNPSWKELKELYAKASIYWHAAGYGLDEEKEPEKMEHFGIATVEAMSAAAVPIVYNGGGQREIVEHKQTGFVWETIMQLKEYTSTMIEDKNTRQTISKKAESASKRFSTDTFIYAFQEILN